MGFFFYDNFLILLYICSVSLHPVSGLRLLRHCNRCATRSHKSPYQFIICLDYMLRTSIDLMKENCLKLAKERSRSYPAQTIMDVDYADGIAHLAITPAQDESLLHSLERAASGIGLTVNVDKSECICFNQKGNISVLKGGLLKQVDKFTYLSLINRDRHKHATSKYMGSY